MAERAAGPELRLHPGREKSLLQRHPWVFSGAIAELRGAPASGDTVAIRSADGRWLARAAWSPESQIRARVWSFDETETVDAAFFDRRVGDAVRARAGFTDAAHTGCRLIHGESDGLPGVIADRYGDVVVLQLGAAGAERWRDAIVAGLRRHTDATCLFERSDADVREREGLPARVGPLYGTLPDAVTLVEDGLVYRVDVAGGQKTGFYLDQRDNRARVRRLARGRETLNVFCYTGGFTLAALAGGAPRVLSIDSSAPALALARDSLACNPQLPAGAAEWRDADAFTELRRLRDAAASFDLIVLDPPKLAPTAHHAEKASRAYKDINLLALKLLRPGGLLATFSCSGGVDAALFRKIVAGAALDARADAAVIGHFAAAADHPCSLAFPEGEYLKGLLLRKAR
ncbi:MAG: class I SAM-dependent methyltransferase [Betaproteobacteria bacterium]|nr:class I SAM-dependent methyltransferase [Betaproteobacteria bacterium]